MGRTNEFTLVAGEALTAPKLGQAVKVSNTMVQKTPVGVLAGAGEAIDGIITDITAGAPKLLAVAKVGDIVFGLLGANGCTVGADLEVGANGALVTADDGVVVAKALATGVEGDRIPVIIK